MRDGDIIVLYTKEGGVGGNGFLASDMMGTFGSSEERLLVAPADRTAEGTMVYPPAFQTRCMFRIDAGHMTSSDGLSSTTSHRTREEILYGQPIMLVHVNTDMYLTATSKDDVQLQSDRHSGCFFIPEPRYKLRSEGEKISSGDHILLQSRRFVGAYLRLSTAHSADRSHGEEDSGASKAVPASFFASMITARIGDISANAPAADEPEAETLTGDNETTLLLKEASTAQRVELMNIKARLISSRPRPLPSPSSLSRALIHRSPCPRSARPRPPHTLRAVPWRLSAQRRAPARTVGRGVGGQSLLRGRRVRRAARRRLHPPLPPRV